MSDRPFRFGVHLGPPAELAASARRAEEAGFDIVTAADHVGHQSPFLSLAAAAAVTERVRLRTYVLDVGFWNPGLLARDVATLDAISGGRVDLGLGAGHMASEHEDVGIDFPPAAERVARLEATALEVRERLAREDHRPAAVQQPVPLVVGAMSRAGLAVAARHADVVALSGALQRKGEPAGTLTLATAELTDERVAEVRAGGREPELDALLQLVDVHCDPEAKVAELAETFRVDTELLRHTPYVLLAASPEDGVRQLRQRRERWGITSWCTHEQNGPALAEVAALLRQHRSVRRAQGLSPS
jgi:probable F420-dependent oxidoreductase